VVDPRKGALSKAVNLGTGLRLSDIDMRKQRDIAARELITETLRGQPGIGTFEKLYVREPEALSPRDWMLMRIQATQRRRYSREKREAARQSDLQTMTARPSGL
jgi:hypothetical protein